MGVEALPHLDPADERQFIRFAVQQVPRAPRDPEDFFYGHDGEWLFRADIKVDGRQRFSLWFQPAQDLEPEPDPRIFVPKIMALVASAGAPA